LVYQTDSVWYRLKKYRIAYLWISPFFVIFLVFWAWPVIYTFILSLQKWELIGDKKYIAFKNFLKLFKDEYFWRVMGNTIYYWIAIVPLRTFLVLVLASILNSPDIRMGGYFRATFLLPYLVSTVFIGLLFRVILAGEGGWVNVMLASLIRIEPVPWLVSTEWSKASITLMTYWRSFGYFAVIMLGGLQRISPDLVESAIIDGASSSRIFFKITIPLVLPTIFFVVMISTIRTFSMFEAPFILTAGGPSFSSTPLALYMFNTGFDYFKLGYASAIAVVIFVTILFFSLVQFKVLQGTRTE